MNGVEGALNIQAAIDRIVDLGDVVRQLVPQFTHAGRRGGGHDYLEVRQARFERTNELGADVDFADAYGMHPKRVTIGDGLLELGIVSAEPLSEALPPITAPPHSHEVVRR